MSWWPFSGAGANAKAQAEAQQPSSIAQPASTPPQPQPQFSSAPPNPPPTTAPHDPDFYAAHPHLAPPSFSTNSPSSSTNTTPTSADSEDYDPSLPRTMSCRAAFDSAFYCSSLGGHFNDIYRYGQLRSCSEHWNDFWFCMRTKNSYSGQDIKERLVQDRYAEKERKLREGSNCEDVWERRRAGEEVRGAFGVKNEDV